MPAGNLLKCGACGKFLSPTGAASCAVCPLRFHRACVLIADSAVIGKAWACPECKKKSKRGDNSGTPVRDVCGSYAQSIVSSREAVHSSPETASSQISVAGTIEESVRELRREMAKCLIEMREFRSEMAELRTSVAGMNERMDGLERRLNEIEQRQAVPGLDEIAHLERTVVHLKHELNDRNQEALLSDLEIGHLPEEKGENIVHTISLLAVRLGVPLEERDIVFAERLGGAASREETSGAPVRSRRVVVRLARRSLREELLRAARVRRTVTTTDAGQTPSPARIYINERLTRHNRQLFHKAREECRRLQWRYSWTRRGRVLVRQGDGKPAHYIRSEEDLLRVFGSGHV